MLLLLLILLFKRFFSCHVEAPSAASQRGGGMAAWYYQAERIVGITTLFFLLKVLGFKSSHKQEASFDEIDVEWLQPGFHSQYGHHQSGSKEDLCNTFYLLNKPIVTLLPHWWPCGHLHWWPFFHLLHAGMPSQIKCLQAQLQRQHQWLQVLLPSGFRGAHQHRSRRIFTQARSHRTPETPHQEIPAHHK